MGYVATLREMEKSEISGLRRKKADTRIVRLDTGSWYWPASPTQPSWFWSSVLSPSPRMIWWLLMWGFGGIMGLFLWFVMFVLTGIRFGLYRWIFGYWILVWAHWDLVLPRHLGIPRFFLELKYWLQRKLTVQECFFRIDGGVWWVCTNHYSYPTSCFVLIEPSCFNLLVGSEVWRWNLHISGINCLNDPKDCTVCITAWIVR